MVSHLISLFASEHIRFYKTVNYCSTRGKTTEPVLTMEKIANICVRFFADGVYSSLHSRATGDGMVSKTLSNIGVAEKRNTLRYKRESIVWNVEGK